MEIGILLCFLYAIISLHITESRQNEFLVVKTNATYTNKRIAKRDVSNNEIPQINEFIVRTNVANRFAETNCISKVENTDIYAKQTTFSVVLPERAFISAFSMEIDGQVYKGFVKEKEEAKKIYGQMVSSGQTAAHVGVSARESNRFTVHVNVEPESKVNFYLTYEELLQREDGQYEILVNIQPGQIVKTLQVEVNINENRPLLFVRTPSLRTGNQFIENNPNLDTHANVQISGSQASVKFHPGVDRQLQFACSGLGGREYSGFAGQFVVQYDIERDAQGGETLFQDGFFINFFAPTNLETIAKHVVFVLDTSGSMDGLKIEQLKDAMSTILPQLNPEDCFNIVQYSSEVYLQDEQFNSRDVIPDIPLYGELASQLQIPDIPFALNATEENTGKAKNLIAGFEADGSTNSIGALEVGLYLVKRVQEKFPEQYQSILVFLTDGQPNIGIADPEDIVSIVTRLNEQQYKAPLYSLCLGKDVNYNFLKRLSLKNYAEPMLILAERDASVQLQDFYRTISKPVLSDGTFTNLPPSAQLTKASFPIFFDGSEIIIAGKGVSSNDYKPITVSAKGKQGPVNLEAKIGMPLCRLERIWAYLTIKQLLDQIVATSSPSETAELYNLALDLALNYSLVTDVTSLVVVKPNGIYNAVDAEDASEGIFPESPDELPICANLPAIPDTSTTTQMTTKIVPPETTTTKVVQTTQPMPVITTMQPETTPIIDNTLLIESRLGLDDDPTEPPTTTQVPTTTERLKTCNDTQYGCCFDGNTTALGPNHMGCDPIPKPESCSLQMDKGPCLNYTSKWFYNSVGGECQKFYYGGCGGTDNRFSSKEACEKSCMFVSGPEACKLPISLGKCAKFKVHWFYSKKKDKCVKYMYSGCLGNSNRFGTEQECLKLCVPKSKKLSKQDSCRYPRDSGRCERHEINFYFDNSAGVCRKFWYGGCGGNSNRFKTLNECIQVCIKPNGADVCLLPPIRGPCPGNYTQWHYNSDKKSCGPFIYGGCNGNKNNFNTLKLCQKACVKDLQDACHLQTDGGPCDKYVLKWTFNSKRGVCTQMWYGGCDGNNNRFDSDQECKNICISPQGTGRCKLPKIKGPCSESKVRWYYNKDKKQCKEFEYGGCFGNNNNFNSEGECNRFCNM